MSDREEFHVMGQPLDGTPLHYTASGLDYVYLQNGFTVENDPDYGRIVTIQALDDLHRAIGLCVVTQPRGLTGAEFRFLRKQMGLKQKDLAANFGVDVQTVANYEKGRKIPDTSDVLVRLLFILWIAPADARADMIKALSEQAQQARHTGKTVRPIAAQCDLGSLIVKQWQMGKVDCHV